MPSSRTGRKKKRTGSHGPDEIRPAASAAAANRPGPARTGSDWLGHFLIGWLLLATFLAYVNALNGQFVYGDRDQIVNKPTLQSLANIPAVFTLDSSRFTGDGPTQVIGTQYRPLFTVVLILNYHLFGMQVLGWHLASLLLHLGATLMLYFLAMKWGMHRETAFAAALLFGLHPVHSESVAWAAGLAGPLTACFVFWSLILYERRPRGSRAGLVWSPLLALAAMFSHEVAVVLPVFIAVRELFERTPREPIAVTGSRLMIRTAPYLTAAAVYLAARFSVLGYLSSVEPEAAGIATAQVLLTLPSVLLGYVRLLFLPYPLAVAYDLKYVTSAADPAFWGSALALLALVTVAVRLVRSSAAGRLALIWLILFLLPFLNLKTFNHEESLLHDRHMYLPSVGFCLLAGLGLGWLNARFQPGRKLLLAAATVLAGIVFFTLTVYQNGFWRDDSVLAQRALSLSAGRPFLHNYLGAYYFQQGRLAEAERSYLEATKHDENYYVSHHNLGDVYRAQGRYPEAESAYLKALEQLETARRIAPDHPELLYVLGEIYSKTKQHREAAAVLSELLAREPEHRAAQRLLAASNAALGDQKPAQGDLREPVESKTFETTMQVAKAVMVTVELDFGPAVPSIAEALRDIERRHEPIDGQGRTFAVLDAYGEPTPDGKLHMSMHVSSEKAGRGFLVFRRTGEILWEGTIIEGSNPPPAKTLTIFIEDTAGNSRLIDGSGNPQSILDARVKDLGSTVREFWADGDEREVTLIYSSCGCPVKLVARREGEKTVRTTDLPVIFPDDPDAVTTIARLMRWP